LGSGHDNNTLTLTAADSGSIIFVTPTNALGIILPTVGTETGMFFKIVIAAKIDRAFTIKTGGDDGNDTFFMRCQTLVQPSINAADPTQNVNPATADVAGDTLTITNALEGSWINLTNVQGGDAEIWVAEVFTTDTVASTCA